MQYNEFFRRRYCFQKFNSLSTLNMIRGFNVCNDNFCLTLPLRTKLQILRKA